MASVSNSHSPSKTFSAPLGFFESPTRPPVFLDVEKCYKAQISPGGSKVLFPLPPELKTQTDRVYAIWKKDEENLDASHAYVGSTTDELGSRLYTHAKEVSRKKNKALVYTALASDPELIRFGAVNTTSEEFAGLEIGDQEKKAVSKVPKDQRLNSNEGGTGGLSLRAAQEIAIRDHGEPPAKLPLLADTPEKRYPVKANEDGSIAVVFTPKGKAEEGVIYSFKDKKEMKHYAGYTSRSLGERAVEHTGKANRLEEIETLPKKPTLYHEMSRRPLDFSVGIHASGITYPAQLVELEKQLIEKKDSCDHGYNQNRGGGGCFKRPKKKGAKAKIFP